MCWYIATSYPLRWWQLRAFVYYVYYLFHNIYYLPVEKKLFQDIRIELREPSGEPAALEASIIPTKVVLHFRRV